MIELLSWRRLGLHAKPIVFLNLDGFWDPLFALFRHILGQKLIPAEFDETWTLGGPGRGPAAGAAQHADAGLRHAAERRRR